MGWRGPRFLFTVVCIAAVQACTLDSSGAGDGGGEETGSDSTSSTTFDPPQTAGTTKGGDSKGSASSSSGEPDTSDPSTDSSATSTDDTGSTTEVVARGPFVEISDAETFDFGQVDLDAPAEHTFSVTNIGDEATANMVVATAAPFSIANTDCGASLDPAQSCSVSVSIAAQEFGPLSADLEVTHDGGMALRPMTAVGVGTIELPLVNPGGEMPSTPPDGWEEVLGDAWTTAQGCAYAGARCIYAGPTGVNGLLRLRQDVAVDQWATLIDDGDMSVTLSGWLGSFASGDDDTRLRVSFFDDANAIIDGASVDGPYVSTGDFVFQEVPAPIPAGGRTIRVLLDCDKGFGSSADCYFDEIFLTATYAP